MSTTAEDKAGAAPTARRRWPFGWGEFFFVVYVLAWAAVGHFVVGPALERRAEEKRAFAEQVGPCKKSGGVMVKPYGGGRPVCAAIIR